MLVELNVSNYAVIDSLQLTLGPGFNVLTGETGAGKSIILGALGLLLGDRSDGAMVRAGADRAYVEGIFELGADAAALVGDLLELDVESDGLILSREVASTGRSVCRVNGRAVPLRKFAEVGALIVDVHGQGEHLSLLRPAEHLNLLDRYGGLTGIRGKFGEVVRELGGVRRQIARINNERRDWDARSELLSFQAAEISAADLSVGEDDALVAERTLLINADQAVQLAKQAVGALEQDFGAQAGAIELVGAAVRSLSALEQFEPGLETQRKNAESAALDLQEVVRELNAFSEGLEKDDRRLAEIEERLDLITSLKRKYGPGIEDIVGFGQSADRQLQLQRHCEQELDALVEQESELAGRAAEIAAELSHLRMQAASDLTSEVEEQLDGLGMGEAKLAVAMENREDERGLSPAGKGTEFFSGVIESARVVPLQPAPATPLRFDANGVDRIEFLISANPGEPLKPLASTASGGETSRLMLAIKGALVRADPVPTLVFDEIDSGIGGRIGEVVGKRLWSLGRQHQVVAVTHLPQIASCGDLHISVRKVAEGERTVTKAVPVTDEDRVGEIGTMLGSDSAATRLKAAELLSHKQGPTSTPQGEVM